MLGKLLGLTGACIVLTLVFLFWWPLIEYSWGYWR